MRKNMKYIIPVLAVLFSASLSSCGPKTIGWGVLYVEDEQTDLKPASLLKIHEESDIRESYTASPEDSDVSFEIPRWKVNFFKSRDDALAYSSEYSAYADIYATTTKNGLSIRSEADINSDRVYKLREDQTIKIISRQDNKVDIAGHNGYWYFVMTEDGSSGWCFDLNLDIYDVKNAGSGNDSIMDDPELQLFFQQIYRPEYYRNMIRGGIVDLSRFRTSYGLFPFPDENSVVLTTEDHNLTFDYTGIIRNSSGRFIFEGSSLQVQVRSASNIAVYFTGKNNREYAETMIFVNDIDKIIESEIERRTELFEQIMKLGTVSSSAYGRIEFGEDRIFNWSSFKRLVPNVIPETAKGAGKISLNYFPGPALKEDYDGVLSFAFDNVPGLVNFLFKLSDLGIKLVYVPAGSISKNIVEQESASPLVIFMSGAGE